MMYIEVDGDFIFGCAFSEGLLEVGAAGAVDGLVKVDFLFSEVGGVAGLSKFDGGFGDVGIDF